MKYLLLYWSILVLFYVIGARTKSIYDGKTLGNRLLILIVFVLVIQMGLNMGSNEEVLGGLQTIGLISTGMTIVLWVGTILAIMLTRKFLGMNREARLHADVMADQAEDQTESQEEAGGSDLMMPIIIAGVIIGVLSGYFLLYRRLSSGQIQTFTDRNSDLMILVLCLLLADIGYIMGLDGTVISELRSVGLKILYFPIIVLLATAGVAILMGVLLPQLSIRESLCICFGFGWYTFAPGIMTAAGHQIAGAICFLHNVLREIFGLMLIPVVARKLGYIESISLPGIACMDVGLPIILGVTRSEMVAYAVAIGLLQELSTLVLIPILMGA